MEKEEWFDRVSYNSSDFQDNISKEEVIEEWFQSDQVDLVGYNLD